ncbi:hypothetical protein [Mangrovicoccus algicola]|uniref:Uncharacterized protein n=1 Tax=Mangrovicoccus algicola TaxID=2771008 RepID=A0A8J6Z9X2_9RHOB|nr:hypothetical protein [Mangrovicoccus algicola]MBE3638756.1 hypothetical protein [Mangrovicoccus algicola]
MRRSRPPVLGHRAAPPRPTCAGAFWLASVLSLPAGLALVLAELGLRLFF